MLRSRCIGRPQRLDGDPANGRNRRVRQWVLKTSPHGERFGCNGEPVEAHQTTMDVPGANLDSVWS